MTVCQQYHMMKSLKKCRALKGYEVNPTTKRQQHPMKIFSVHQTKAFARRRPEEMNDSDEEVNPWRVLIHEDAAELRTKPNELVQSFENNGFSEIDAKKQAFSEILPELQKELGNIYLVRLQWMFEMKRDPVHRKIMKTKDAFVDEDEFDPDEALAAAVRKRKFLLKRMLEDRQHFPDEEDDDQDNACISYESRNDLH